MADVLPDDRSERITPRQFHETAGVEDWRFVAGGASTAFRTGSFAAGARLVAAIGELTGLGEHRPDVDLRCEGVTVRLLTIAPGYCGLTRRDVELARQISAAARELGLPADPSAVQTVQVSIDALVRSDVTPFWRALLGYVERDGPADLMDPFASAPAVYFAQMDAPRPQRNRIHLDVYVPYDRAEARIEAAIAAGGRLVTDRYAPEWWVLADAEGNEACVATFGWIGEDRPQPR
ncbi:MAG: VOC family protein [Frankiaceae bacterium]